jgi:hypothetical protein
VPLKLPGFEPGALLEQLKSNNVHHSGDYRQNPVDGSASTGALMRRGTCIIIHGSNPMLKKVFFAAAMSLAMVGAAMTTAPTEVLAGKHGCYKKAKAKYGMHLLKRHSYKKACKAKHK